MTERAFFDAFLLWWTLATPAIFIGATWVVAPYGRHARPGWGPTLPARPAWILTELPAVAVFAVLFALGDRRNLASWVFLGLWELHYVHRTFVFPFLLRASAKRTPLSIISLGFVFNLGNAYINGRYLFSFAAPYPTAWLLGPRFVAGLLVFVAGMAINRRADAILRDLRAPGETGYKIPQGSLYRWVTCPNYLGEMLEWAGWAIATWSLAGLSFALWTAANLVPRARAHHAWYRERFPEYPPERKAVFPGLL